ncbi:MAG: CheR family methyltransferase [Candidatus Eisenbacteria bacterium]
MPAIDSRTPPDSDGGGSPFAPLRAEERAAFQQLIRRETGIALNDTKHELIASRIGRRVRALGLDSYGAYYRKLSEDDPSGAELREFIDCVTTNKTSFFREEHHFEFLQREFLPRFPASTGARLRIWSAACSSGEEPYSIAITLREAEAGAADRHEILASDISTRVLRQAELGVYDASLVADLPRARLERHFLRGTGQWAGQVRVRPEVRAMVRFSRINLMHERWPVARGLDLIFCRNALIYFDRPTQDAMLRRFARMLSPDGLLVLGHSENLTWLGELYERVGQTIYRLRPGAIVPPVANESSTTATKKTPRAAPPLARQRISIGEMAASAEPREVVTVLGSCVAACLHDPVAGVGGMNHFLLPDGEEAARIPSRYGVHAMELLINAIMREGGDRRRLRGKVFGGAHSPVLGAAGRAVAERNAAFVRRFLEVEGIPLLAERLGGERPLEVRMETHSGKVRVRALEKTSFVEETRPPETRDDGGVTLF